MESANAIEAETNLQSLQTEYKMLNNYKQMKHYK